MGLNKLTALALAGGTKANYSENKARKPNNLNCGKNLLKPTTILESQLKKMKWKWMNKKKLLVI